MAHDPLDDFQLDRFTHGQTTHPVYRKGEGPGVVVISEVPGITPEVADFARRVVDRGFTVAMPDLFGEAGRPFSVPYVGQTMARLCVSREFTMFARRRSSPVTTWLRALGRDLHQRAVLLQAHELVVQVAILLNAMHLCPLKHPLANRLFALHDQAVVALTSEGEGTPVAFVDIRSAPNNCFLCRVVREG